MAYSLFIINERLYGAELDEKYGKDAIAASNCHIKEMTFERCSQADLLEAEISAALTVGLQNGNPAGVLAQKACALHEKWLRTYYSQYTKEYHREMGALYSFVMPLRFSANKIWQRKWFAISIFIQADNPTNLTHTLRYFQFSIL